MTRRHILVLVENMSVPRDRRVWQECRALVAADIDVTVVCPMGQDRDHERDEVIDGVRILRYPPRPARGGMLSYLLEYAVAVTHTLRLAIAVCRERRVDAVHACNPPDLLFLVARVLRRKGARFVFDHHDLVPELFAARFPHGGAMILRATRFLERLTFASADAVISVNDHYRHIAIERGRMPADRVVVIRNAPDLDHFIPREPDECLRHGKQHLLTYLGVMGPQDGVDRVLRAVSRLRHEFGRDDVHCTLMGAGDSMDELVTLSAELGIDDITDFPGWVGDDFITRCLSTADVCLSPDPRNAFTDISSMTKVLEYMAMGRPVVSFDLAETRRTAGSAAVLVPANDEYAFAAAIDALLDDPDRRRQLGSAGRQAIEQGLSWQESSRRLVSFYRLLLAE